MNKLLISLFIILTLAGCSTTKHVADNTVVPMVTSNTPQSIEGLKTVNRPAHKYLHSDPQPIWNNAKIREYHFSGYVDEHNRAHPPTSVSVIDQKGSWNLDAINNPSQSYIPEANVIPIPGSPSGQHGHMIAPGTRTPSPIEALSQGPSKMPLLEDTSRVLVLGIMDKSNEQEARNFETDTHTIQYFASLGWCLVPREQLIDVKQLPNF